MLENCANMEHCKIPNGSNAAVCRVKELHVRALDSNPSPFDTILQAT